MTTTYCLHICELTDELVNTIKAAFKDKTVEIVVSVYTVYAKNLLSKSFKVKR